MLKVLHALVIPFLVVFLSSVSAQNVGLCAKASKGSYDLRWLSLENRFPGITNEIFNSQFVMGPSFAEEGSALDIDGFLEQLRALENKLRSIRWFPRVRRRSLELIVDFRNNHRSTRTLRRQITGLMYEAAIAAQVKAQAIYFDAPLGEIAKSRRVESLIQQNPSLARKEVDIAWYNNGKLYIIEAKHAIPATFGPGHGARAQYFVRSTVDQSKRLTESLRAFRVETVTYLVASTLTPEVIAKLKASGAEFDGYIAFDPYTGVAQPLP